jgi:hypothetical protein
MSCALSHNQGGSGTGGTPAGAGLGRSKEQVRRLVRQEQDGPTRKLLSLKCREQGHGGSISLCSRQRMLLGRRARPLPTKRAIKL